MNQFYVITNTTKLQSCQGAQKIQSYLQEKGAVCSIHQSDREFPKERTYRYTDPDQIPEETECLIVLGGDGTIIQAAHDARMRDIPIIGINFGTLGYLAEIDESRIYSTLDLLLSDQYMLEERMMLEGEIIREGKVFYHDSVLNDIVLSRNGGLKVITFRLYVDGQLLNNYQADGMIIATPTGSTAYSLSCGGPVVMPTSSLVVATPICPHSMMNARSIILPADVQIALEVDCSDQDDATTRVIHFDASQSIQLEHGDQIRIRTAETKVHFIRLSKISFLENIRQKMNS